MKQAVAKRGMDAARIQMTAAVVDEITAVRQAWTEAVAARQLLEYAEQVRTSAASSLLRRDGSSHGKFG